MSKIEYENKGDTDWQIYEPVYYYHYLRSNFLSAKCSNHTTQVPLPNVRENAQDHQRENMETTVYNIRVRGKYLNDGFLVEVQKKYGKRAYN